MRLNDFYARRGKRIFDVVAACILLTVSAPLQAVTALAIRAEMGSPVLFRQVRPGLEGRPFILIKFRTMSNDTLVTGQPEADGERLTRLGRTLRSLSLDEFPQLFNVLKGEMSLVGPRPLLMDYLEKYTPEQMIRHDVRPGITGLAQVQGRNELTWDEKFACDVWYVRNLNFRLDLRIILGTVGAVLGRRGINAPDHDTMPEF